MILMVNKYAFLAKSFFLIFFLFQYSNSFAQKSSLGMHFGLGVSRITSKNYMPFNYISQKYILMPSLNIGLSYSNVLSERSNLRVELLLQQIEGLEKAKILVSDGTIELKTRRDLSYLGIPLYYSFIKGSFVYEAGIEGRILLFKNEREKETDYKNNGEIRNYIQNGIIPKVKNYNIGINSSVNYKHSERSMLGVVFFMGINNIYVSDRGHPGDWRVQQLNLVYKQVLNSKPK